MATISHESALRKITIAAFLPAFPLLVASGVMSDKADGWVYYRRVMYFGMTVAYFGLIPVFFSALSSLIWVSLDEKRKEEGGSKKRATVWLVIDLLLALGHLAVLILIWVREPHRMNGHADWMMLETYATCFLIVDMVIHAYLFLCHANKVFRFSSQLSSCPHCVHCHQKHAAGQPGRRNRDGYSLLPGIDEEGDAGPVEGRPSEEV